MMNGKTFTDVGRRCGGVDDLTVVPTEVTLTLHLLIIITITLLTIDTIM